LVVNAESVVRFIAHCGDRHVPLNPSPDVQEGVPIAPHSSVRRRLSLTGAIFARLSTMMLSTDQSLAVGRVQAGYRFLAAPLKNLVCRWPPRKRLDSVRGRPSSSW
jgi:hypothetical protein